MAADVLFHFVDQNPVVSEDRRLAELRVADARSHAARIAHLTKKQKKRHWSVRFVHPRHPTGSKDILFKTEPDEDDEYRQVIWRRSHDLEGKIKNSKSLTLPQKSTRNPLRSAFSQTKSDPFDSFP